ncbi:MAG: hypothetical protein RBS78_07250 [Coriobacteriia bacterium]|jgi:hypothetical protein|nr:hypothetical protein [Coriobacteriia bacterium]
MRPSRETLDIALFALLVLVFSTVLSYPVREAFSNAMFPAAIASVMLAALGVKWPRKIYFAILTLGGYVAFDRLWGKTPFATRMLEYGTGDLGANILGVLYVGLTMAYPVAMLLLFVGKNPSVLWSRDRS